MQIPSIDWTKIVPPLFPRTPGDDGPNPPRIPTGALPMPAMAAPQTLDGGKLQFLPPTQLRDLTASFPRPMPVLSPDYLARVQQAAPAPLPPISNPRQIPADVLSRVQQAGPQAVKPIQLRDLSGAPAPSAPLSDWLPVRDSPQFPRLSPPAGVSGDSSQTQTPALLQPKGTLARDLADRQRMLNEGSGVSQIASKIENSNFGQNHHGWGKFLGDTAQTLATVADIGGRLFAPNLEAAIPGTEGHHQVLLAQNANRVGFDDKQDLSQATLADEQAQASQRQSLATQEAAKAFALTHPKPNMGQLLYDKAGGPIGFQDGDGNFMGMHDPNLPSGVQDILGSAQRKQPTNAFELWQSQNPKGTAEDYLQMAGEGKVRSLPEQYSDALSKGDQATAQRILKVIHDTSTQPKIDVHAATERPPAEPHQMVYVPQADGSTKAVEVTAGTVIPAGASKTPNGPKISADEQKRADLAQNMNENIAAMEDILTRRPELFGPVAGRWTQLKNAAGTSDPDVAKLMTLEHQLGMVAQGAHSMRSAQGVASAAQSLTNGFHNSPAATRTALDAAKQSVQTFLGNSQAPGQARYSMTAVGNDGHRIGSNDNGGTWFDVQTGKRVQ